MSMSTPPIDSDSNRESHYFRKSPPQIYTTATSTVGLPKESDEASAFDSSNSIFDSHSIVDRSSNQIGGGGLVGARLGYAHHGLIQQHSFQQSHHIDQQHIQIQTNQPHEPNCELQFHQIANDGAPMHHHMTQQYHLQSISTNLPDELDLVAQFESRVTLGKTSNLSDATLVTQVEEDGSSGNVPIGFSPQLMTEFEIAHQQLEHHQHESVEPNEKSPEHNTAQLQQQGPYQQFIHPIVPPAATAFYYDQQSSQHQESHQQQPQSCVVQQYVPRNIQQELDVLRGEVADLRAARESDNITLALKDQDIRDLRSRLNDVRSMLLEADASQQQRSNPSSSNMGSTPQGSLLSGDILLSCLRRIQGSGLDGEYSNTDSSNDGQNLSHVQQQQSSAASSLNPHGPRRPLTSLVIMAASVNTGRETTSSTSGSGNSTCVAGVKSIWAQPTTESSSPSNGAGVYGQDGPPNDEFLDHGSSNTPTSDPLIIGTANSLHPTNKGLWIRDDAAISGILSTELMCEGMAVGDMYGFQTMMNDDHYLESMSPTRLQQLGISQAAIDHHTSANFHYLVDKIVKTNDQPASLLLQQRLKTGNNEIKALLFEAVRSQALPLIRNRFGNFLMQRCLEHGTSAQVRILAGAMIGHIYALSCDRFGCHVVQKALDVCEDDVKLQIISELLRAIPETITHRFACHVWQRVFETRWSGVNHRARVAQKVDAALKGQWHLVANDENGSLVVQCVFENCDEADKVAIVREVLAHTVEIARGQWGNWVIQHLLEHGSLADKQHILKVVARHVYSMSIDQFASKVVEKGLKTCQRRDLYDIVDMVLSPSLRDSGPGILDMMNNQYANYVVQHILTLSDPNQRDACARLIAPHLPILRGSKYGQRVAAIVEKHIRTSQQRFGSILSVTAAAAASHCNAGVNPYSSTMIGSGAAGTSHSLDSNVGSIALIPSMYTAGMNAIPNWNVHHALNY